ncbi:conjugal transfer mating-pair stabilization protein TraG [Candidatus Pantoea multigeneris]|uniref:Conjugal transfer mating pair stabilization protein TraG n=1 Tax=Candidatus Pantoea multigeneris TaxID=2608357 RepID=A0ABX0RGK8_9GAMM|nr:conjugal transfer mating-pair stabilization protein TraG [Pantoea multigeneris]NIF23929.1 conjugal transfer mating pair stabilization protein TraG [Pantoea multigeneris]
MALDVWVVSQGGMITMGLNAVASLMENSGWRTIVWIAEFLGILMCAITYFRTHDLKVMFAWGLTFTLVTALLLTPKTTVVVNDLTDQTSVNRVDNVPLGLAVPLWLITGAGYTLASTYEDFFHFPDERAYTKTGMLFASKLMQDSFTVQSEDPSLTANMLDYTRNCVVPDVMLNQKYSFQDVMSSEDVQSVIFSNPSPLRGIYWRDGSGSTFMFCKDAAPKLKTLLQNESSNTGTTFLSHVARMIPGNTSPQAVYASQLAGSYNYFFDSSKSAQQILMQNIAVDGLRRGFNSYVKGMNDTASMVDIASEMSLSKLRLSHAVSYQIATEVLPQLHTVLMLFCICIFPVMVLALYVREVAWGVIKNYLNFMGSLMLWPVMFSIFNFAVNFSTQGSYHSTGPTLSNMNRMMETSSTTAGIAGWLMLSIPFLAFKLFTQLGQNFASLSSSFGSALAGAASGDSASVASGNIGVGNVQLDNINGHKTDLNYSRREGMSTVQLPNGAMKSVAQDGTNIYDALAGSSKLGVDLQFDKHLASAAQKMTRDSMAQTDSLMQGYNHSVQESGSQLRQFHEQYGNSDSTTLSSSTGMSITDAERVNKMQHVAQDYAERNHISLNQAYSELEDKSRSESANAGVRGQIGIDSNKSLLGKAGAWMTGVSGKADMHAGLEYTGRNGSTSQTSEGGQSGKDSSQTLSARESQDFSQGMDVLRNYSTTNSGQHTDNNASGLLTQVSSGITTSDSKYTQFTSSEAHTHELQAMASETQTLSAGARENLNQQFVGWVEKNSPQNAEAVLTNTADEGIAKQREALVDQFVGEKLQGRIDSDYAANAGKTGQGIGSPGNSAAAQYGGAYDSANSQIDKGVESKNINTGVKKDVEDQGLLVKDKYNETQRSLNESRDKNDTSQLERKVQYEQSNKDFTGNMGAAVRHQDETSLQVWPGKTYKDFLPDKDK